MKGSMWWIDRWRQSTAYTEMTLAEQGGYRNLCDEVTKREGPIPDDEYVLAKACGDPIAWPEIRDKVMAHFVQVAGGWVNETALRVLGESKRRSEKQQRYRDKRNAGGNAGGNDPGNAGGYQDQGLKTIDLTDLPTVQRACSEALEEAHRVTGRPRDALLTEASRIRGGTGLVRVDTCTRVPWLKTTTERLRAITLAWEADHPPAESGPDADAPGHDPAAMEQWEQACRCAEEALGKRWNAVWSLVRGCVPYALAADVLEVWCPTQTAQHCVEGHVQAFGLHTLGLSLRLSSPAERPEPRLAGRL